MVVILLGCKPDIKMLCGQHTIWCLIAPPSLREETFKKEGLQHGSSFTQETLQIAGVEPQHSSATSILLSIMRHCTCTLYFKYSCHLADWLHYCKASQVLWCHGFFNSREQSLLRSTTFLPENKRLMTWNMNATVRPMINSHWVIKSLLTKYVEWQV